MPETSPRISVIDPLSPAIERMKEVLFRPFDLNKWFVIGFGAWLAYLGQGGGQSGFGYGGGGGGGGPSSSGPARSPQEEVREGFEQARQWIGENLGWLIPAAAALFVLILVVALLVTWLSSRGRFLFLHCVAHNVAQIAEPWKLYASRANSLFLFRVVLGLVTAPLVLGPAVGLAAVIFQAWMRESFPGGTIALGAGLLLVSLGFAVLSGILSVLTHDFVVPIMLRQNLRCLAAWKRLGNLLAGRFWTFVLYLLFVFILSLTIGAALFAITLLTCCIAGCILAIPYLGTVILLPVLVFTRSYSACFLAQFGPEYNVFSPSPATATGALPSGR